MTKLLTPAAAAAALNICPRTLAGLVRAGAVKYVCVGLGRERLRRRFDPADLDAFIAASRAQESPCPSIKGRTRRSGTIASNSNVVAIADRLEQKMNAMQGNLKEPNARA